MPSVCFYFQVHQPYRLRPYTIFDTDPDYFDDDKNRDICRKVAEKCYLPSNNLLLEVIEKHAGRFKVSFSVTGVLLEQLQAYSPEVLDTFRRLADTGCVEFLAETYYHSLSSLFSEAEFIEQIRAHMHIVKTLFGQTPRIFRNTELLYSNQLAETVESMQCFDAIVAEGADRVLGHRSPNFIYRPQNCRSLSLLLKNFRLSDDIAFRFSDKKWSQWPLTADKFAQWVSAINGNGFLVNLFMDYETFGEHQWHDSGIFHFLRHLPEQILRHPDNDFKTLSEAAQAYPPTDTLDVPAITSWADTERDLSAWLGNSMQTDAVADLYALEPEIRRSKHPDLLAAWRKLQTSDHFYYMCTKYFADGDVHKYFNPYESPYDAYINYTTILEDLRCRCSSQFTLDSRPV